MTIAEEAASLKTQSPPIQSPAELSAMEVSAPPKIEDVTPPTAHELNGSLLDAWRAIIDLERRVARIEKGS